MPPTLPSAVNPGAIPSAQPILSRSRTRVVLIASPDSSLRERLRRSLVGLRWQVLEAPGGAEAWVAAQSVAQLDALVIDPWLPDLEVEEFLREFHQEHSSVDLMFTDGTAVEHSTRSPHHQELLYALHRGHDGDTASWQAAPAIGADQDLSRLPDLVEAASSRSLVAAAEADSLSAHNPALESRSLIKTHLDQVSILREAARPSIETREISIVQDVGLSGQLVAAKGTSSVIARRELQLVERIPELIGSNPLMLEVSRRIRLVAAKATPVLIEGPTGSGKELVAEALHRLSSRSRKPFVAINCAAIPEALLEAELFGHTRGAFTGAVQGRTGRIESADGGTLFLDEIGEMPLALQSKLLRFFECGELQRIGDNDTVKVDVRIISATHQPLAEDAQNGLFRADLYYRLAVFLIRTPALVEHMDDLPLLVSHFLERMGRRSPVKRIDAEAVATLSRHSWPGNVRELEHVLERAAILAGDEPVISEAEIDFGQILFN